MKRYKCEMCGKTKVRLHEHHVIPWYLSHDDSESNIMRICASCHAKADSSFDNLILRGKMNVTDETHKRITGRYKRKHMKYKQLYYIMLCKYVYYYDMLGYNTKTGIVIISHSWHYRPNRHISASITGYVSARRSLAKAASSKGQIMLGGRC